MDRSMMMRHGLDYAGPWFGPGAGLIVGFGFIAIIALVIWSIYWKGKALWHAARKGDTVWFVILLVVNTAGILEILYLHVFDKKVKPVE